MNFIQNKANIVNNFSRFFIGYLRKSIKTHGLKFHSLTAEHSLPFHIGAPPGFQMSNGK